MAWDSFSLTVTVERRRQEGTTSSNFIAAVRNENSLDWRRHLIFDPQVLIRSDLYYWDKFGSRLMAGSERT